MDYLKLLEESYAKVIENRDDAELERLDFLAQDIFNFTTYENLCAMKMAHKALEVCRAISTRSTFSYFLREDGEFWFYIMVNMPFFVDKIDWGTSIRGAWWSGPYFKIETCGLFYNGEQILELILNDVEWDEFIETMIIFVGIHRIMYTKEGYV